MQVNTFLTGIPFRNLSGYSRNMVRVTVILPMYLKVGRTKYFVVFLDPFVKVRIIIVHQHALRMEILYLLSSHALCTARMLDQCFQTVDPSSLMGHGLH